MGLFVPNVGSIFPRKKGDFFSKLIIKKKGGIWGGWEKESKMGDDMIG